VLVFIGVKMLIGIWQLKIDIGWALGTVGSILALSVIASLIASWRDKDSQAPSA
jgi:hypothetical protein